MLLPSEELVCMKNHFLRGRVLYIDSEKSIGHYTCTRGGSDT